MVRSSCKSTHEWKRLHETLGWMESYGVYMYMTAQKHLPDPYIKNNASVLNDKCICSKQRRATSFFPHIIEWGSCFSVVRSRRPQPPPRTHTALCTHLCHTHTHAIFTHNAHTQYFVTHNSFKRDLLTHNLLIHTLLSYIILSHTFLTHNTITHTTLSHTSLSHTTLSHTQLFHTYSNSFAHTTLSHTVYSHTTLSRKVCHTHTDATSSHTTLTHTTLSHISLSNTTAVTARSFGAVCGRPSGHRCHQVPLLPRKSAALPHKVPQSPGQLEPTKRATRASPVP